VSNESDKITTKDESNVTIKKTPWYWFKDTKGTGSVTVTLVLVSFWVTTIAYVFSIFEKIGPMQIRPFDVGASSSYFLPILTLYFGRKFTDAKFNSEIKG
jgi:hypothetical protein